MMRSRVYILVCMLCMACVAGAQVPVRNLTRARIDSLVHPTLHAEANRVLRADRDTCELGTMDEDDQPVSRTFHLRNVSREPQRILRVRTSCGCTVASFDTTAIAPGKEATIILTYNPKNRPGTIDVDAYVYVASNDRQPTARLSLYGEVVDNDAWSHLPYTMGHLRVKRTQVYFTELPAGGRPSMRVLCANSGDKPLRLSSQLLPAYATFRTEPAVIAPGEEADLVITIDVDKLPKRNAPLKFGILIDGLQGRPSERTLQVEISKQ